jgi:hypothetical protein
MWLPAFLRSQGGGVMPKPQITIFGGVRDDPGSRRRFIASLRARATEPCLVAVEWDREVFVAMRAARQAVAAALPNRWKFLTALDAQEVAAALAWEGDAHAPHFPYARVVWLEDIVQQERIRRQCSVEEHASDSAQRLLDRLCDPCRLTMSEWMPSAQPPTEPTSTGELVDRVSWKAWSDLPSVSKDLARDARWAEQIKAELRTEQDGWAAVVVGWAHADPASAEGWLRDLLVRRGFDVESVSLAP